MQACLLASAHVCACMHACMQAFGCTVMQAVAGSFPYPAVEAQERGVCMAEWAGGRGSMRKHETWFIM